MTDAYWIIGGLAVMFAATVSVDWWLRRHGERKTIKRRLAQISRQRFSGPPITPEMQQLFGAYSHGSVVGVLQLRDGLVVTYEGGPNLTFIPVPAGDCLYVDGETGDYTIQGVAPRG